jgi:hypothetical protein
MEPDNNTDISTTDMSILNHKNGLIGSTLSVLLSGIDRPLFQSFKLIPLSQSFTKNVHCSNSVKKFPFYLDFYVLPIGRLQLLSKKTRKLLSQQAGGLKKLPHLLLEEHVSYLN